MESPKGVKWLSSYPQSRANSPRKQTAIAASTCQVQLSMQPLNGIGALPKNMPLSIQWQAMQPVHLCLLLSVINQLDGPPIKLDRSSLLNS